MSQVEAGEFVETVAAEYYQPVPAAMFKLSRLRSAKRETRVKWIFGIITKYVITSYSIHYTKLYEPLAFVSAGRGPDPGCARVAPGLAAAYAGRYTAQLGQFPD